MERVDRILAQEEYAEIQAEIIRLEMEQALMGKDNSKSIEELKKSII